MGLFGRVGEYRMQQQQPIQRTVSAAPQQQFQSQMPQEQYIPQQPQQYVHQEDGGGGGVRGFLSGKIGWLIFALIPAILVGIILYVGQPSIVVDEDSSEIAVEKVLMFCGLAASVGLAIKAFIFP